MKERQRCSALLQRIIDWHSAWPVSDPLSGKSRTRRVIHWRGWDHEHLLTTLTLTKSITDLTSRLPVRNAWLNLKHKVNLSQLKVTQVCPPPPNQRRSKSFLKINQNPEQPRKSSKSSKRMAILIQVVPYSFRFRTTDSWWTVRVLQAPIGCLRSPRRSLRKLSSKNNQQKRIMMKSSSKRRKRRSHKLLL